MNKAAEEIKELYDEIMDQVQVLLPIRGMSYSDDYNPGSLKQGITALKNICIEATKYAASLSSEVDRLRRLVEDAYIQGRNDEKGVSETIGWEQFKRSHNL